MAKLELEKIVTKLEVSKIGENIKPFNNGIGIKSKDAKYSIRTKNGGLKKFIKIGDETLNSIITNLGSTPELLEMAIEGAQKMGLIKTIKIQYDKEVKKNLEEGNFLKDSLNINIKSAKEISQKIIDETNRVAKETNDLIRINNEKANKKIEEDRLKRIEDARINTVSKEEQLKIKKERINEQLKIIESKKLEEEALNKVETAPEEVEVNTTVEDKNDKEVEKGNDEEALQQEEITNEDNKSEANPTAPESEEDPF